MTGPRFEGGSPISQSENPYNSGAGAEERTVLDSLPVEGHHAVVLDDLDGFGVEPITSDTAADRPLDPPTTAGGRA